MSKRSRAGKIIQVDFTGVETRELIPDGDYAIKVKEVTTEEGDKGKYLNWNMVISTGEYKGKALWYITSLTKQSLWNLRAVLEALGLEIPKGKMDLDLSSYKGLEMGVAVETEKYRGKTKNVVVDIYNLEEEREEGEGKEGEEEDLEEMSLEELIEYAEEEEIDLTAKQKKSKSKALAAIQEAEEEEPEPGAEPEEKDLEDMSLEELVEYAEEEEISLTRKQKKSKSKALAAIQEAEEEPEPEEEPEEEKPKRRARK